MKRLLLFLALCWCYLVVALPVGVSAATVQVLSPADASYVENEKVNLVIALPDSKPERVKATVGKKSFSKQVSRQGQKQVVCFGVALENGHNTIRIEVSDGSGVIAETTLKVYRRSALSKPYQIPPGGYARYYFHQPERERLCQECHRMEPVLSDLNPVRPQDSPCYGCHKDKTVAAFPHKPAAAGGCLNCHELVKGKPKYSTRSPGKVTCFLCHSHQDRQWKTQKFHHGPTAVGNCAVCHDPHGSGWPDLVRMHPTDLCLNCHHDKKSGRHVIAGFFAKGHPVRGQRNPFKPDRDFSCAACHNPHAGTSQSLLNGDRSNQQIYCQTCHKM